MGRIKSLVIILITISSILYATENNSSSPPHIESIEKNKLSKALFETKDTSPTLKKESQLLLDKDLQEFVKEAQRYQEKVFREWVVLIIMAIAGIGGFILVFINIFKIKKMQDEIEDRQNNLMKDILESEKYV